MMQGIFRKEETPQKFCNCNRIDRAHVTEAITAGGLLKRVDCCARWLEGVAGSLFPAFLPSARWCLDGTAESKILFHKDI